MILDNCDGKQAKWTQSGSPLGLIFDHGVDLCTTFLYQLQIVIFVIFKIGIIVYFYGLQLHLHFI